jgi:hypothetical protein
MRVHRRSIETCAKTACPRGPWLGGTGPTIIEALRCVGAGRIDDTASPTMSGAGASIAQRSEAVDLRTISIASSSDCS